ncbi:SLC13 family permease [Cellulomonas dongxiuzhuiae]|uniref:Arsenic transporter n=1 Tax=Cellulomonas dongxiuzhuiae TaxID=2819979 RepID=A0ABX8GLR0_9CELL|nr:SLC13 family permease [Cellulomonas dongxiuzhuiae]MBO3096428.1 arsenic transporter [Cellulomonas dongxiuzhuiae]QWC16835.1 arsenic transporter [Cellulomonas dongxiuzhuiae]
MTRTLAVGSVLLAAGLLALLAGVLPVPAALALAARVWPVLTFVVAMTVVTELAAAAGLFRAVGAAVARRAHGRTAQLWGGVVVLAVLCTVFLSLDTTAVLLTPVVLAVAVHARLDPRPFALVTVWVANTGSMLLPVSNLTNLLAAHHVGGVREFVALTWAPALACVAVPVVVVALVHRRRLRGTYEVDPPEPAEDPVLLRRCAWVVGALLVALVSGAPVWVPAVVAALVLLVVTAQRRSGTLTPALVPWPLLVLASGLFLAAEAVQEAGLRAVLEQGLAGGGPWAVAATGLLAANALNNLPAYLLLEPGAAHDPRLLVALLVGVNAGPLITPWASLATLLWHRALVRSGVDVPWGRYVVLGLVVAPLTVAAGVGALALTT